MASRKRKDKKRPGRAILMNRGRLRNSIRGTIQGDTIVFGTDVPYAKIHNEGGTIQRHARSELFVRIGKAMRCKHLSILSLN